MTETVTPLVCVMRISAAFDLCILAHGDRFGIERQEHIARVLQLLDSARERDERVGIPVVAEQDRNVELLYLPDGHAP